MIVNTSTAHQRGLRCNLCPIVKQKTKPYLSAHVTGNAVDFTCSGLSAEEARQLIKLNSDWLPHSIRLEEGTSWVHLDVYDPCNNNKINTFTV